jgi:hypothetical protein
MDFANDFQLNSYIQAFVDFFARQANEVLSRINADSINI